MTDIFDQFQFGVINEHLSNVIRCRPFQDFPVLPQLGDLCVEALRSC